MFRFSEMLSLIDYTPDGLRLAFRSRADIEHFELPRRLLHGLDHLDLHRGGSGAELPEPSCADEDARFERAHGAVEGLDRPRETAPQIDPVPAQVGDPLVELGAELADLLGIHGDRLLPPAVGD